MSTFSDYDNILIYNGADRGQTRGEKPKNEPQHMFAKGNTLGEDGVWQKMMKEGSKRRELTKHQLLLISLKVCALALKTKQWCKCCLDRCVYLD